MKKYIKLLKSKSVFFIFLIFLISFINLRYFFKPGIFSGHDLENHLARIANYYLAIKDGHLPPRWAKNLNHKFGYPVFNYNYPLANILAYPLIVVDFDLETSLKIILFSAYLFSGIFFYLLAKNHFSRLSALIGAVFYLCAPYQFLDLYVRGVVGENLTLALFPAVLYFLFLMNKKPSKINFIALTISLTAFSLSHNIMVYIFTPLMFLYWLYLLKKSKDKLYLKASFLAIFLGFAMSAFFWIPAFFEKQFITLNAFDPLTFYKDHFVNFNQLVYSKWQDGFSVPGYKDAMSFQLGIISWLVIILALFLVFYNLKKEKPWLVISLFFIFSFTIFLMLPSSEFLWRLIPFIGYLQFPWRLLGVAILLTAVFACFLTEKIKLIGITLAILSFLYAQQFVKPFNWQKKEDIDYYDFLFTTSVKHENQPIWFSEDNIHKFKSRFLSQSGLAKINELSWKTNRHEYEISVPQKTRIWEHTAYFPGWEAYIDGNKTEIEFGDKTYPGLINFKIPSGKHMVVTKFTNNTKARLIGNIISLVSLALFLILVKLDKYFKKNKA